MKEIARFIKKEVARQSRKTAGFDFGKVEEVANGLVTVRPIGSSGTVSLPYYGNPGALESVSLSKGRGLVQSDGPGLYG